MRILKIIIIQFLLIFVSGHAQSIYFRPVITNKINNYSASYWFSDFSFYQNNVKYNISTPNFRVNSRINLGLNLGIKGKYYFFETGVFIDQATSETRLKIEILNEAKTIIFSNKLNTVRNTLNGGFSIFEIQSLEKNLEFKHQLWLVFGFDFFSNFRGYKNYKTAEKFTLLDNSFVISNEYYFPLGNFLKTINLGLEYRLISKTNKNILCFRVNYLKEITKFPHSLINTITISNNSKNGSFSYFYPAVSSFNGIYFSLSREFELKKRIRKSKEKLKAD